MCRLIFTRILVFILADGRIKHVLSIFITPNTFHQKPVDPNIRARFFLDKHSVAIRMIALRFPSCQVYPYLVKQKCYVEMQLLLREKITL